MRFAAALKGILEQALLVCESTQGIPATPAHWLGKEGLTEDDMDL